MPHRPAKTPGPRDELQQLMGEQYAAMMAVIESIGRDKIRREAVRLFLAAGGDLAKARRTVQVAIDISIVEELSNADFPGPLDYAKPLLLPWIREFVARVVAKKFDQLASV